MCAVADKMHQEEQHHIVSSEEYLPKAFLVHDLFILLLGDKALVQPEYGGGLATWHSGDNQAVAGNKTAVLPVQKTELQGSYFISKFCLALLRSPYMWSTSYIRFGSECMALSLSIRWDVRTPQFSVDCAV